MNKKELYQIKTVGNNLEKANTYKKLIERFNDAKSKEYYFECMWILFAMIEDRTSAFLCHIGFTSIKNRNKVTERKFKKDIRQILNIKNKEHYKFNSLFGKLQRIQSLIDWAREIHIELTNYQKTVKTAILKIELSNLNEALEYLNIEWRLKRNQITHTLFQKSTDSVLSELKNLVENGYKAIRIVDKSVSIIKKENIVKKFNID